MESQRERSCLISTMPILSGLDRICIVAAPPLGAHRDSKSERTEGPTEKGKYEDDILLMIFENVIFLQFTHM